ncbi:MAG: serine/threonine protein phosphatase [Labilithrix sp.]|nr:serine/threonine protein phosphatase [Labilithrix sp.]MCW5812234.1 serine/threonine protein phosphatase [Labilithrix sp.]
MAALAPHTGRTIVVGDVHGCAGELHDLLDRVAFASGDRLVFVGDLVARGPDSLGVLDVVRATGALVVRGNHEQKLIEWDDARAQWIRGAPAPRVEIGKLHRELARALRPIDWSVLRATPVSLDFPEHDLRVVHAGLDPALPFEQQNPATLMRIRTVPLAKKAHVLWGTRYAGPPHVVFGHNAAPRLQLHAWATGLDTGCVYGGQLTALVLAPGERIPRGLASRRTRLVSVPARRTWFEPTRAAG